MGALLSRWESSSVLRRDQRLGLRNPSIGTDYTTMMLEWNVGLKEVGHFGEYGALSVGAVRQDDEETTLGSELVIEDRVEIVADAFV